ncbi:MAG TPA: HAD-IA family hydrolase [Jiangellaceae bacterium]|nr:HAD-IA family hydrolase [Jiangellaceae bacterium]
MTYRATSGLSRKRLTQLDLNRLDAIIFDIDGVLTDTATVHAAAWEKVFDEFLRDRFGDDVEPFDAGAEYRRYVDGKPRLEGAQSFLEARGLLQVVHRDEIEELAARKEAAFTEEIERNGVQPYPTTAAVVSSLRDKGARTAAVSASQQGRLVLDTAGLLDLFDVVVDGVVAKRLLLPGTPDPALFHEAAYRLGVPARRAAIVEDALSGIEAGRRGIFGFVVGVERSGEQARRDEMRRRGADMVIGDLAELEVTQR